MKIGHLKILFLVILTLPVFVSEAQNKVITIEDMEHWPFVDQDILSAKGNYVGFTIKSEIDDPTLYIYDKQKAVKRSFARASSCKFNENETHAFFKISPSQATKDSLERAGIKKKDYPSDTLGILDLSASGEDALLKMPNCRTFSVNDSFPNLLCVELEKFEIPEDDTITTYPKDFDDDNGRPLLVMDVVNRTSDTLWYVTSWKLPQEGRTMTAMTSGKDSTDEAGILIYDLETRTSKKVLSSKGEIKQKATNKPGDAWAFVADLDTTKAYVRPIQILIWRLGDDSVTSVISGEVDLLQDSRVSEFYEPKFTEAGNAFIFGHNVPPAVQDTTMLEREKVDVEIWTKDDGYIYPMQNERKKELKERVLHGLYHLDSGKVVPLTNRTSDELVLGEDLRSRYAVATDEKPYLPTMVYMGYIARDVYGIDLTTGENWLIEKGVNGNPRLTPDEKMVYWRDRIDSTWMGHDLATRKTYTWTNPSLGKFEDELHDTPNAAGSYGLGGFSKDGETAYIYDRYDIWAVKTRQDLSANRLTKGREKELKHYLIDTDPINDWIDDSKPQMVYLLDEKTKSTAYATIDLSSGQLSAYQLEAMARTTRPEVSKDGSTILYTKEDYNTAPELRLSDLPLSDAETILTDLGQYDDDYGWGNIRLVEWSLNDKTQTGMLVLPNDFEEGRKYPLIINFYERSSDGLHRYRRPYLHRSTMNYPHYSSRGYIIFNPDISYQTGYPGKSALDIVESGIDHLVEQGFVDESRIALQGHSWGGYQIAYILAHSNRFRCAESGAPVVNMTSAYGGIRWGSGMSRMFQYERTQSRLGNTLWEDREAYLRNSPLFDMDKVNTPVLILHNNEDGAVPWYQGIEYYMALRRLNKPVWLLNYRGEPHWPLKLQNRKDFQRRMAQFFDHYMLGKGQPDWMKDGVNAHLRGIEDGLEINE